MQYPSIKAHRWPLVLIVLSACTANTEQPSQSDNFTPGLGEIMAMSATRHAKLWLAGQAQNWELAAYEVDELLEGFEDTVKYHPTHKEIKRPLTELIPEYMDRPLKELEQAVKNKNSAAFSVGYDNLTAACNACHQATDFGFNIVTRPIFNPFSNQKF